MIHYFHNPDFKGVEMNFCLKDNEFGELLRKAVNAQAKSADIWIDEFRKHKDKAARDWALFAIGKVHGAFNVMLMLYGEQDIPEDIFKMMQDFQKAFDEIRWYNA